jgi:signal transduction histidine kinase
MRFLDALARFWPKKLIPPRRIKLSAAALAIVCISLVAIYALGLIPGLLGKLADLNNTYSLYIRLTNALLALMCAAFLLWPLEGGKLVGGWNRYVGLAFFTFVVQYGLRSLTWAFLDPNAPQVLFSLETVTDLIVFIISTVNNLLILAAARVLLNKKRPLATIPLTTSRNTGVAYRLRDLWLRLRAVLPKWIWWVWLMLPVSLIGVLVKTDEPYLLWTRIPDALFSVYCLSWFGYALYLSFYVRRQRALAWMAMVVVLAYGAGQLAFAGNPIIAYATRTPELSGTWLTYPIAQSLAGVLRSQKEVERVLDGAIFALLAPMKYLLFLPAFILYLLSIISVNVFRRTLRKTTSTRTDYLSSKGILSAIGNSLEADEVELLVRLPGHRGGQDQTGERALAETWSAAGTRARRRYTIKDHPFLKRTMLTEGEIIVITNEDQEEDAAELRAPGHAPQTLTLIPVKFHGGVIGVLRVIFRGYGKYNDATLEQLKFMAELIAPSVQDFRTVAAVDKLGRRFNRAQVEGRSGDFTNDAERIVEILHDLLNPLSIGLIIHWGFTSIKPIYPRAGLFFDVLQNQEVGDEKEKTIVKDTERGSINIEIDRLSGRTEDGNSYYPGNLMLAIPAESDHFAQPTLAAYYLTRRMVASLIANGISAAARNSLAIVIEDLGVALNKETLSIGEWFAEIDRAAHKAGLMWTVAELENGHSFRGDGRYVELVSDLADEQRETLISKTLSCIPLDAPGLATRHIINLELRRPQDWAGGARHRLFFGVTREKFGQELSFQSPWKDFLEKLANVAGVALISIEDRQSTELKRRREADERLKQAQDEWLKTMAVISAMLMHQLVNMVKNQLDTAEHLLEILPREAPVANNQIYSSLTAMRDSAEMMQDLTNACIGITKKDKHSYCSIEEAAVQAESLFQFALKKQKIEVTKDIPPGTAAKVQSNLVSLALASLIGNAIDAIKARGRIEIKARIEGDSVWCHVINTGGPIPGAIVEKLFQPGTTGKNGHRGWGLYLVSRALREYDGAISLLHSNSDETCFTLRLPRASV